MYKKTIEKLLAAGYVFLRISEDGGSQGNKPKIKYSDAYGVWRTLEIFNTKVARNRRLEELINEEKYLFI